METTNFNQGGIYNQNADVIINYFLSDVCSVKYSEAEPHNLFGRNTETDSINEVFVKSNGNGCVCLSGIGGIGKTSIGYLYLLRYKCLLDNWAFVTVNKDFTEDIIDCFVNKCEIINSHFKSAFKNDNTKEEQLSLIKNRLSRIGDKKNNLLVLDVNLVGEETKKEIETNLWKYLPNNWNVLIMTRLKPLNRNRFERIDVECVDFPTAKSIFELNVGNTRLDVTDENYQSIFADLFFHPLLIEIVAKKIDNKPNLVTIQDIYDIIDFVKKKDDGSLDGVVSEDKKEQMISDYLLNLCKIEDLSTDELLIIRHFILWPSMFISYDILSSLLKDIMVNPDTLTSLRDKVLTRDDVNRSYLLHGLLIETYLKQIDVESEDYTQYIDNIRRINEYNFREFLQFADCIGNSLCKYEITKWVYILNFSAIKFNFTWKTDYAKKLYEKCIEILKIDLKTDPENIDSLDDLSTTYCNFANLQLGQLNDYKSAEKYYYNAMDIIKRIITISDTPRYQNTLSTIHNNLAVLQKNYLNKPETAATNYKDAINIQEKLTKQSDEPEYLNGLARLYFNIANLQQVSLNDLDAAERYYNKAILIGKLIQKHNKFKSEYLNWSAAAHNNLANVKIKRQDYDAAKENVEKAIKIYESIKDKDIENLVNWIEAKGMLAEIYIAIGKPDNAKTIIKEIKPIAEEWLEKIPKYGELKRVYNDIKANESKLV